MLLTRAPLYRGRSPFSCDLHVLGAPLTFVLSQDQTLQLNPVADEPALALARSQITQFTVSVSRRPLRTAAGRRRIPDSAYQGPAMSFRGCRTQFSRTEGRGAPEGPWNLGSEPLRVNPNPGAVGEGGEATYVSARKERPFGVRQRPASRRGAASARGIVRIPAPEALPDQGELLSRGEASAIAALPRAGGVDVVA